MCICDRVCVLLEIHMKNFLVSVPQHKHTVTCALCLQETKTLLSKEEKVNTLSGRGLGYLESNSSQVQDSIYGGNWGL